MNASYEIEISNQQDRDVKKEPLVEVIRSILLDHEFQTAEISVALVDDPSIRQLNLQYLQHDYETDVISFVLDESTEFRSLSGQLVVSTDTAFRFASELNCPWQDELLLYVVHGMLHLVGYRDKNPQQVSEMRQQEKKYLARLGISPVWRSTETDESLGSLPSQSDQQSTGIHPEEDSE
ncbi:MAG: rRNA maturation RNase YbeY [Planctomycetota bacterium]